MPTRPPSGPGAASARAFPTSVRAARARARARRRSRPIARHPQDPARERRCATPAAASSARRMSRRWRPGDRAARARRRSRSCPARVMLQDFTGVPGGRRPRGDARRDGRPGRRPGQGQPAGPGRPGHRPLGPGRRFGAARARSRSTSSASTSATASATSCCAGPRRRSATCASSRPGPGIVHQVNLEYLATVVDRPRRTRAAAVAFPDTLVGTDSHTTMINGLGVLGYGVGGIEAEAVLLGQPLYQPMPRDRRRAADGRAAARLHRDRPRAGHHRDAARARRGRLVRRVRRRRARRPGPRRPGDDLAT